MNTKITVSPVRLLANRDRVGHTGNNARNRTNPQRLRRDDAFEFEITASWRQPAQCRRWRTPPLRAGREHDGFPLRGKGERGSCGSRLSVARQWDLRSACFVAHCLGAAFAKVCASEINAACSQHLIVSTTC